MSQCSHSDVLGPRGNTTCAECGLPLEEHEARKIYDVTVGFAFESSFTDASEATEEFVGANDVFVIDEETKHLRVSYQVVGYSGGDATRRAQDLVKASLGAGGIDHVVFGDSTAEQVA